MIKLKIHNRPVSIKSFFQAINKGQYKDWAFWLFVLVLAILSILASINFNVSNRVYVVGQIATSDVTAERDMKVEDLQATKARRKQILLSQPQVYDFSITPYNHFQERIIDLLRVLNTNLNYEDNATIQQFIEDIPQINEDLLSNLASGDVQNFFITKLLPQIRTKLDGGIVGDAGSARVSQYGYVLRNLDNNEETILTDKRFLPDLPSFLAELSSTIRQEKKLSAASKRAIDILLAATIPATLTLNRDITQKRGEQAANAAEPVFHYVQKGEVLVHKGDRITREKQLILQLMSAWKDKIINWRAVIGTFICALLISCGLFFSPSDKPSSILHRKDLLLISVILFFTGAAAKCVYVIGKHMDNINLLLALEYAFPVAGAVGLIALVFAAKRYCTMALLLSFFVMLIFKSGYHLFIYYFLGGMLATWLVMRSQSRQDVVWSVTSLSFGLLLIWIGVVFLTHLPLVEMPTMLIAAIINALLSLIVLFAVSPVLEMAFSYSTRFRLMELMSLEQPLMQEIMVTAPGTYHHSLVVANMVEAAAKAIGANSLLCKVAALYHDAGKIIYPEYFIENQFGAPNKHDKLAPSMSALILLSHVKKGTELSDKYSLGQEITDIIKQHHGTRVMRFFYQKAINQGEKPNESDYCYPGPRPQSKEAAILMLADSVEASSRTLTDPTPARINNHIDKIIKGIFAEGQLDESELTFKDLHYISDTFQRILTGLFHQRISYPDTKNNSIQQIESSTHHDNVDNKEKPNNKEPEELTK